MGFWGGVREDFSGVTNLLEEGCNINKRKQEVEQVSKGASLHRICQSKGCGGEGGRKRVWVGGAEPWRGKQKLS